mgnify:CR=1 FL=1
MNNTERKCLNILADLDNSDQQSVLSFAEFLRAKAKEEGRFVIVQQEPLNILRPEEERVVAAIKRLSETYPMIKKNTLLDETSTLMSAHILQGRVATDIIDDLEVLFAKHYKQFTQQQDSSNKSK